MSVFESLLSMRVITVATVTDQNILNSLLIEISYYDRYSIDTSSFTPPHNLLFHLLHSVSNKNLQNAVADAYRPPPQNILN